MQRGTRWMARVAAAAVAASVLAPGVAGASGSHDSDRRSGADCVNDRHGRSLRVIVLTADGALACSDTRRPGRASPIGPVTGLTGDTALVGIDFRPATGALVGLGNQGGIYTIDPATGAAANRVQLSEALAGTSFGVDFNPTVDRLRVVSDTGQNLRVNVDTGVAAVDLTLSAPGVPGVGYTNNDADPNTATTLYDIDTAADQVSIQAPPNNGTLNPVGKLGVDTSAVVGFDIFSELDDGTTDDVSAFASLTVGGSSGLYEIDLFTGRASHRGNFAVGVTDIAIPLDR
jgi:Domain of unknown function (DUF4394)